MKTSFLKTGLSLYFGILLFLAQTQVFGQAALFSDNFETDSSANWGVFDGSGNGTPDYEVLFAFDYSTNKFVRNGVTNNIPAAPNGGGKGVKMHVNKNDTTADIAAVSLYPTGRSFSNDFALKFDMWLSYNGGAYGGSGSTEFATFGINHPGDKVNWSDNPGTAVVSASDGVWFGVTGEGGAALDYRSFVGDGSFTALRSTGAAGGFLDRDGDGTVEDEVIDTSPDTYPLSLMFPTPQFETPGVPGKQWVQVEIRQRTNEAGGHVVTWLMDHYVIAEHLNGDAVGMTSGNIMLGNMDIFSSIADPKEDNFVIYDNVRVLDLSGVAALPVITVVTNDDTAAEPGADTGSVTIARSGSTAAPLTVNYRMTDTASNGVDYSLLPGSVTLASGQTSTNLIIQPINDTIGEPAETVTLVLLGSTNYDLYTNVAATVTLLDDNDVPLVTVSTTKTNAYEPNPDNEGRFTVTMSNPGSLDTTVKFTIGGTAVSGTDFSNVGNSILIPAGQTNAVIRIRPINNNTLDGNRTVTLTLSSGTGYALGATTNGTVTIRDDDFVPTGTVVYTENFEVDPSAAWVVNASGGNHPSDLFFDYSAAGIPPAPNSTDGSTHGAKLQANLSGATFGGVSISPVDLNLTNDYVLRFDLWQNFNGPAPDGGSGSTQISGGGVGTTGTTPQWPGGTQNSVWFAASGDGQSSVDYRAYSSAAGTGYTDASGVFAAGTTASPRDNGNSYYYEFGRNEAPAEQVAAFPNQKGITIPGAQAFVWRDVVIQKKGTTVKWWIDGKLIATVNADATNFSGGNILLLHADINASSSSDVNAESMAFGLFDNVRVAYLPPATATQPNLTGITLINGGTSVQIDFTAGAEDTVSNFTLQGTSVVSSSYADVTATITELSAGKFRAVTSVSGSQQFYRIRR